MDQVATDLMLPQLSVRFYEYTKSKQKVLAAPLDSQQVALFLPHYYHGLSITLAEFQDEVTVNKNAYWTAVEAFWKGGHARAGKV